MYFQNELFVLPIPIPVVVFTVYCIQHLVIHLTIMPNMQNIISNHLC